MLRIALATCPEFEELDDSERLGGNALSAAGVDVTVVSWDAAVDWASFDAVVLRQTWDYTKRYDEFAVWLRKVAAETVLLNPAPLVLWNTNKVYLQELEACGVPIIPTLFVSPDLDSQVQLPSVGEYVVKPTVGAGSVGAARFRSGQDDDRALVHARTLAESGQTIMVQPFVAAIEDEGETGLVFLGGRFSHAFRKGSILKRNASGFVEPFMDEDVVPREPSAAQLALGEQVLNALPAHLGQPLYARVDMVSGESGPMVMEVELTEPSLFYEVDSESPERFAAAVVDRVQAEKVKTQG